MGKTLTATVVFWLVLPMLTWAGVEDPAAEITVETLPPRPVVNRLVPPAELSLVPQTSRPATCQHAVYRQPMVARVTVPAQLHNGYFVPGHDAYVVFNPSLIRADAKPLSGTCPVGEKR